LTGLNLPPFEHKIRTAGQSKQIFDSLRRKYVALTPEEWVRQHVIHFLVDGKKYPANLISVEKGLKVETLDKRTDLVVFNRYGNPWMIVECKSPDTAISEDTLYQAARYNMTLRVRFLVLTNGLEHYCCQVDDREITFLDDLPPYGS
jgi:type I site-specific restriction endonuclease